MRSLMACQFQDKMRWVKMPETANDTHHKSPRMLKPKTHNHLNWQTKFLEKDSTSKRCIPEPVQSIAWFQSLPWYPFLRILSPRLEQFGAGTILFWISGALWQAGYTLHSRADMGGDAIHILALAALSENARTLATVRRICPLKQGVESMSPGVPERYQALISFRRIKQRTWKDQKQSMQS